MTKEITAALAQQLGLIPRYDNDIAATYALLSAPFERDKFRSHLLNTILQERFSGRELIDGPDDKCSGLWVSILRGRDFSRNFGPFSDNSWF